MANYRSFARRSRRFGGVRRKRRTRRTRVPTTLAPSSKLVKMHAVEYFNATHTNGALSVIPIQHNSIDDVFVSNSNVQPLGYDQYKSFYKKAIVVASKVLVQVHNNTDTAVMVGITAVPPNQGTTNLSSYEHYMESPKTKSRLLSPDVDRVNIVAQVSTKKLLSLTNYKDNKDELEIDLVSETPPSKASYWHLWSQPQDQTTGTTGTAVQFTVTVSYIVLLYDPIIPARSTDT